MFDRTTVIKDFLEKSCLPLLVTKGKDYTDGLKNPSPNANFETVASLINAPGVDKYIVWMIYFSKHFCSLAAWIKNRELKSEPISSRLADLINYLLILHSMLVEDEDKKEEA